MRLLICAFILMSYAAMAQTKQQLIKAIIKNGEYIEKHAGQFLDEPKQYANFRKLNDMVTPKERLELAKHKNSIVRMYFVTELISRKQLNAADVLAEEFRRNETVREVNGCLVGDEPTSSFIYILYWNMIDGPRIGETHDYVGKPVPPDPVRDSIFRADATMMKMDSIVLYRDDADYFLYRCALKQRKFPENYLPRIEEFAFKRNNTDAVKYLLENYNEQYKNRVYTYWKEDFPKADFSHYSAEYTFQDHVEMMLETKDLQLTKIAVAKLAAFKSEDYEISYFLSELRQKYGYIIPVKE